MIQTLDYEEIWFLFSLSVLVIWAVRTRLGLTAFVNAPHKLCSFTLMDVLLVSFLYLSTSIAGSLVLADPEEWSWSRQDMYGILLILGLLFTAGVIIYIAGMRAAGGLGSFGLSVKAPGRLLAKTFCYAVVVFGLTFLVLALTIVICQNLGYEQIQEHPTLELLEKDSPLRSRIILVVLAVVIAPLIEELLFRGLLQNFFIYMFFRGNSVFTAMAARRKPAAITDPPLTENTTTPDTCVITARYRWSGIIFTSLIFALFHSEWQHWPALFVLGMGLGYSYERNGSLWIPITMHSLFNLLNVLMLFMQLKG